MEWEKAMTRGEGGGDMSRKFAFTHSNCVQKFSKFNRWVGEMTKWWCSASEEHHQRHLHNIRAEGRSRECFCTERMFTDVCTCKPDILIPTTHIHMSRCMMGVCVTRTSDVLMMLGNRTKCQGQRSLWWSGATVCFWILLSISLQLHLYHWHKEADVYICVV